MLEEEIQLNEIRIGTYIPGTKELIVGINEHVVKTIETGKTSNLLTTYWMNTYFLINSSEKTELVPETREMINSREHYNTTKRLAIIYHTNILDIR